MPTSPKKLLPFIASCALCGYVVFLAYSNFPSSPRVPAEWLEALS